MLNLAPTVAMLLKQFGQPATLTWPSASGLRQTASLAQTQSLSVYVGSRTIMVTGAGLVSQVFAYLPATEKSPSGAKLTVGAKTYTVGNVTQTYADGAAVLQEVVLS